MTEETKTPSFSEEFNLSVQKKLLTILLYDPNWAKLNGLEIIRPEYFENVILNNICKWIHEYYAQYKVLPTKTVLTTKAQDYMNDHGLSPNSFYVYTDVLDQIFDVSGSDDFEFFKNKAVIFARQIAWKQILQKSSDILRCGNYEEAMRAFEKVLSIGSESDTGLDLTTLTADAFISLAGDAYDTTNMIKTGIKSWDDALGGGFVRKNLHIIGAPPGSGKSRTMAFLTVNALKNFKRVIHITLELSEAETMANVYTSITGIGLRDLIRPENKNEFTEKLMQFKSHYGCDLTVKFFKPGCVTADTLHNFIQKVIQVKRDAGFIDWVPDVIFLDYMDKLLPTQKIRGNSYEDMGGVATDCKNLAISFNCPVITGSQLGRYTWNLTGDNVVSMDSIAESAAKVHICHSMTTLNANKDEKELMKVRLYMAKSRSGSTGKVIWCENNLGKCTLREIEPWNPNEITGSTGYTIKDSFTRR